LAFTALKLVGAVYMIWLGVQALRAAGRGLGHETGEALPRDSAAGARRGFRQGLFSDLANPKIAVFFTSLLPQFVSGRAVLLPCLVLGLVFVLMTLVWLSGYAVLAARISRVLTRPAVKTALDRVTGVVLIGLGIRLALERR
jgi:threonine/homoserine/homoserine lactone efflux protein